MDRSNSFLCLKYSLISANIIGICVGFAGFITGLARPGLLLSNYVSGAQLAIASVIAILIAIIGLIGALKEHFVLLMIYGKFILISFIIRILWSLSSYWHKGESFFLDYSVATTIMTIILELPIMIFSFLLAHAVRLNQHQRKLNSFSSDNNSA